MKLARKKVFTKLEHCQFLILIYVFLFLKIIELLVYFNRVRQNSCIHNACKRNTLYRNTLYTASRQGVMYSQIIRPLSLKYILFILHFQQFLSLLLPYSIREANIIHILHCSYTVQHRLHRCSIHKNLFSCIVTTLSIQLTSLL